jgi:restriction system protein
MTTYYRVMLGRQSVHATECIEGNFIGADYGITDDLTENLPDAWRDFNALFVPVFLEKNPGKTRIAAGLACGCLWVVAKGMQRGDVVICPIGSSRYRAGVIVGEYYHTPGQILPHRRAVNWQPQVLERSSFSTGLKNATGVAVTVCNLSRAGYTSEIEKLLGNTSLSQAQSEDVLCEDVSAFSMEKHLEDFLITNWANTSLGQQYDIFQEEGEFVGQQYQTDTGPLDILAISKDKKKLLVVELKKGRASDAVVGQTLRYMGYVMDELAAADQAVEGAIIALEDDAKIRRALLAAPNIRFYRYKVTFTLVSS